VAHLPIFAAEMKREILLIAFLAAALIFLVRLFEVRFMSGGLSVKAYILLTGAIFLAVGIWFGWKFTRKTVIKVVEKQPEITVKPNGVLTARETELIVYLAQGLSNKEIAEKIFVTEHTVKKHLNNVYTKLEVTRRTQAVSKARQLGIITS
jgi:DNA-binding CsgD family transcriptional regulator